MRKCPRLALDKNLGCLNLGQRLQGEGGTFADCLPAKNSKFSAKVAAFFSKFIWKLNKIVCLIKIAEILWNSGKILRKFHRKITFFAAISATFAKIWKINRIFPKIAKICKFWVSKRCEGVWILYISKNAEKCVFGRKNRRRYSWERAFQSLPSLPAAYPPLGHLNSHEHW